jgi:nitrate reductase molybdenum cofactor assembly chaperone NarJ/NarW
MRAEHVSPGTDQGLPARTFKALGLLLTYPSDELRVLLPAIEATLKEEELISVETASALSALGEEIQRKPLSEVQEQYNNIFDRTRSLSLHLYEHLYGDSRERGQAMVDLHSRYSESGMQLSPKELPDFLPALCEFLSILPRTEARSLLAEAEPILQGLEERLERRGTDYARVLSGLIESIRPFREVVEGSTLLAEEAASVQPESFDALDESWAEAPITFGVGAAHDSCRPTSGGQSSLVPLRRLASATPSSKTNSVA